MGYLRKHRLLSVRRSSFWQKSRILNVVIIVLLVYLALNFVAIGFAVDLILTEQFPDVNPVQKFTEYLFYYLLLDLLVRFLMQELPVVTIAPYLHLPIRKSKIFHYLLTKSTLSFLNYFPLLIIIPFFLKAVVGSYAPAGYLAWLLAIVLLIFFNNYLTFSIKKVFAVRPVFSLLFLGLIGTVIYLDQTGRLGASQFFADQFMLVIESPVLILIPLLLLAAAYYVSYILLENNAYIEEKSGGYGNASESGILSSFGEKGTINSLILVELRLIMRNTRPKTMAITSSLLLFYGLLFYNQIDTLGWGFMIFAGVFVTGSFMINLGQLVFAWNSSFFDLLLTQQLSTRDYLMSKYRLYTIVNILCYFLTLPYIFFGIEILYINTAVALFNIGGNSFIIFLMNTGSTKRVDLTKGAFFNYEGFGASQFLLAIPILIAPILIYAPFGFFEYRILGVVVLGLIGLSGIIFRNHFIDYVANKMMKRKYKMAEGFRSK